ncbi:MAG: carboxypeptidase regulatory-like domain-containing protein [Bryobacteraceae bacterium]
MLRLSLTRTILFLLAPLLFGQVDRATLVGTVTDPSGAVIPGATVEITSADTGFHRDVQTGPAGNYTFAALPIGTYVVKVTQQGFRPVTHKDVRLQVGDSRTLDISMQIATDTTTISVEAQAITLDRESAAMGNVIGSTQVREMPLNGRHWASLMMLAPGAVNTGAGDMGSIRFSGRSNDDNNFMYDGVDASGVKDQTMEADLRLVVSADSIAEFRVNSSLYTAESGSGGGAQINLVSKGGTNEFHGGLFEFVRNDAFDARNPFDTSKQPFRLNQFGGNIGGPIIKNRTFFYANYEGLRQRLSQTMRADVPSAAFRARATNPALQPLLAMYPIGNLRTSDADIDRYVADRSNSWTEDSGSLRIDHRFNDTNNLYARFSTDNGVVSTPVTAVEGDRENSTLQPTHFVIQYQRIFTPTFINEVKAGINREPLTRFTLGPSKETINVSGFVALNDNNKAIEAGTSYSLLDNVAITRGRHTLKFGGEIRRIHVNVADPLWANWSVTYPNRTAFLNNAVDSVSVGAGYPVQGTRKWMYMAFMQNDFKVTPELTVNLGLRYEFYGVNSEVRDRYRVFDAWECNGFCPMGTPWYFPDRNNFDPRVGLAWAPKALKGKTVFRTGGGIYHGPGQVDDVNTALDNYVSNFSLTRNEAPGLSYPITPFLGLAREVGVTPRSLQRDRRDLYSANWGFSVQQELAAGFVTQVAYSASVGKKLFARLDINRLDPVTRTRRLPTFGRIDEKRQDGNSNFNALQISLHRRVSRGLNWGTEYMWSHSINDNSVGAGEGARPQNSDCRACDRGNSSQDVRHVFTSNWVYALPFGKGQKYLSSGPAARIFGNWEMSGIWTMRSGRPLNITMSRSTNDLPDGNSRDPRPNLVPGVSIYAADKGYDHWFNPAAFATPASRTWGNLGRHIARGPGAGQVDLSLQKVNHITEKKTITLRFEAFNLFNFTQAANPGTNWTSPASFGLVSAGLNRTIGSGTARQLQLALRFSF